MNFDLITTNLKKGFDAFVANIAAYIIGFLIAVFGSILIVTIAPLFYGFYYMCVKGTRGDKIEIKDVFYGFSSSF
jgi:mannitol-specific phosphotransferase system IIBC component